MARFAIRTLMLGDGISLTDEAWGRSRICMFSMQHNTCLDTCLNVILVKSQLRDSQWIWWKEMIVESSARKAIGFPYLAFCCLDQDDEKWMTRFIWYGAFRIGIHLTALNLFSFFFLFFLFVCLFFVLVFFLFLIFLSDPSLSARYSVLILRQTSRS